MVKILEFILFFLVLVQGGFFERSFLIVDIVLFVMLCNAIIRLKNKNFKKLVMKFNLNIFFYIGMICIFIISVIYHKTSFKDCGRIGYMCLIFLLYIYLLFLEDFNKIYHTIILLGVLESGIALFAYIGIELPFVIVNARYMGTFQYANATALFMAIVLMLQWGILNKKKILLKSRTVMLVTLFLTFSIGGIFCYIFFIFIVEILTSYKNKKVYWKNLLKLSSEIVLGMIFAISIYYEKFYKRNIILTWLLIAILIVVSIFMQKIFAWIENINIKISIISLGIIISLEMYIGILFFGKRVLGTGIERIQQMSDAILIIHRHPLFGIGINNWKQYIEKQPSITYRVSLVHNSYLQLGVEAGIFAIIFIFCIIFIWYYKILCKKTNIEIWQLCIVSMVIFHFMIDITFFFAGIIVTTMICAFPKSKLTLKQ